MRRHTTLSALILSSILSVPTNAQARCYDISGNLASDDSFVPCNSTASVSACCASNKEFPDICLEGGLCYATHAQYTGFIYGNGCTDRSGKDSACPQICPGAAQNGWKSYNMLQCNPGTWCCRESSNQTNCCDDDDALIQGNQHSDIGRFLLQPSATVTASSSSGFASGTAAAATTARVTVTQTVTSTPSAAAADAELKTHAVNQGVKVGASLGAVLGVAVLAAGLAVLWYSRNNRRLNRELTETKERLYGLSAGNARGSGSETRDLIDFAGGPKGGVGANAYELDLTVNRQELDGNRAVTGYK